MNAAVADLTGAIFTSVFKLAAAVVVADIPQVSAVEGQCNENALTAIRDAAAIKAAIANLQNSLSTGAASDPEIVRERIDALAVELSRIQTEALTLSLERTIDFWGSAEKATDGGVINWKKSELRKWFVIESNSKIDEEIGNFALAYCVQKAQRGPEDGESKSCTIDQASAANKNPDLKGADIKCAGDKCSTTIVFREPAESVVTVITAKADMNDKPSSTPLAQTSISVAQWGDVTYFPLTARFGETKSMVLALDEFGRRTSFGWSSGARGEEIVGGVQSIAESAVAYRALRDGENSKTAKAEVEALETQQKLNKLKKCQAVLDAGGFVCPEQ